MLDDLDPPSFQVYEEMYCVCSFGKNQFLFNDTLNINHFYFPE